MTPEMKAVLDRLEACVAPLCAALDTSPPDDVVDFATGQVLVALSTLSFWRWENEMYEEVS